MLVKIAWRNIWRSRRRSLITISSIFFAVFFAIVMRSLQLGTYDRLIHTVVNSFSGYIQLHGHGYWNEKTLENSLATGDLPAEIIRSNSDIIDVFPRIETFALAAFDDRTRGVFVVGLDPVAEESMLNLESKLISGHVFASDEDAVLIGSGLARIMHIAAGDTIVLLGQGYQGLSAAGKFPIAGLLKFPSPQMDKTMVLLPIAASEYMFNMAGRATSLVVRVEPGTNANEIRDEIMSSVDSSLLEALTWQEMMPELVQTIQADSSGGLIMMFILYLVISFGIFGTLLMMMNERQYEFGVLLSIGMSRSKLMVVTILEMSFLAMSGSFAGAAAAYPLEVYVKKNPIRLTGQNAEVIESYGWEAVMAASTDLSITGTHTGIVLAVTLVISLYAVFVLARMKPVEAMRK